jgi:acyl carrier protein
MQSQTDNTLVSLEGILTRFIPKRPNRPAFTTETRLVEDLEVDSPRMIDIVLEVEDRFGVSLEDVDVQKTRTIGDLLNLIAGRAAAEDGASACD